jgi:hypothetical protein
LARLNYFSAQSGDAFSLLNKVCRDETFAREPSLLDALAYEVVYGRPVRELFAGLHQQAQQRVAERAKVLSFRKARNPAPRRKQTIIQLAQSASVNSTIHDPE